MGVLADEYIRLRADTSHMSRDVRKAGTTAGRTFGGTFAGAAKRLLAGGALFAGVALVAKFLGDATEAARESNKVGKTTAQIIKSTGGAAKVSSAQVGALATAISLKTGQDDEAIQSGANLLLTFKNVRNEVGAGAKIFDRATLAAVDLSSAGFGSVDSASKMLGKALNDPLKGLTALGRAGVTFTQQQKDQIKVMVESGDVLGAQKLIMKEVESQVGGVAEAQATWAEKAKTAFENIKETVGDFLVNGLEPISKWFVEKGFPAIQDFFNKLSKNKDLQDALKRLGEAIKGIANKDFAGTLDSVAAALPPIVNGMADAADAVGEFYDAIVAVNGIIGKEARGGMFDSKGPLGFITTFLKNAWREMKDSFIENHRAILADVSRFISGLVGFFARLPGRVLAWIRKLWSDAKASFRANHAAIQADVRRFLNTVISLFSSWFARLRTAWAAFWATIRRVASTVFTAIRSSIATIWAAIQGVWTRAQTAVRSTWSSFWSNVKSTASAAINSVRTTISTVLTRITNAFSTAKANIKRIWDGLKGVVSAPVQWIKNNVYNKPLVPVWNRVASLVSGPKLSAYARGGVEAEGIRPGYTPGRDTHAILVGGGEAIMRPEFTRAAGKGWVDSANRAARGGVSKAREFMGLQGFQSGGVVGWMQGLAGRAASSITGLASKLKDWAIGGLRAVAAKVLNPVKGLIDQAMPGSGVGRTVGGIGKKAIDLVLDKIQSADAAAVAAAAATQGAYTGPPGTGSRGLTTWHGGRFTQRFRNTLEMAQKLNGYINVIQGGFRPRTSYSGTSHAGDAIDTSWNSSKLSAMRRAGIAAWHRTPAQGFSHHIHGIPLPGRGYPGGSGIWQAQDYLRGGNGLAGGGIVAGGRGGLNTWIGEGRRDELVSPLPKGWSPANQDAKMDRLIAAIERNGLGGTTVNLGGVHNPLPEKPSITVNKVMQRVAGLGLV